MSASFQASWNSKNSSSSLFWAPRSLGYRSGGGRDSVSWLLYPSISLLGGTPKVTWPSVLPEPFLHSAFTWEKAIIRILDELHPFSESLGDKWRWGLSLVFGYVCLNLINILVISYDLLTEVKSIIRGVLPICSLWIGDYSSLICLINSFELSKRRNTFFTKLPVLHHTSFCLPSESGPTSTQLSPSWESLLILETVFMLFCGGSVTP